MKLNVFYGFAAAAVLTLAQGCSLLPTPDYSETYYYDLAIPEQIQLSEPIEIASFSTQSGDRFKMASRVDGGVVKGDNFNKWLMTPGPMITKYLRLTFRNDLENDMKGIESGFGLTGSVILFEQQNNVAELGIRYELTYKNLVLKKTVLITEQIEGKTALHFTHAMTRAAKRFAELIASECRILKSKTGKK